MQRGQIVESRIANDRQCPMTLVIEPWANEYPMPPGSSYDVVFRGPAGGTIEFASGDQRLVVYGWSGSTFALYQGGALVDQSNHPVPPVPPGCR